MPTSRYGPNMTPLQPSHRVVVWALENGADTIAVAIPGVAARGRTSPDGAVEKQVLDGAQPDLTMDELAELQESP